MKSAWVRKSIFETRLQKSIDEMKPITESEHLHFSNNTDTIDIDAKSIGIDNSGMYDNRGLHIQIRHNRDKDLFAKANAMAKIIIQALNGKIEK